MLSMSGRKPSFRLAKDYVLESWFYPGLWLPDSELDSLKSTLESITLKKIRKLPAYGVYLPSREPYMNRIITVVSDSIDRAPVGFGAMVYLPMDVGPENHTVIHLGLVITTSNRLGRELLFLIYFYPLLYLFTFRKFRSFWITSVSMEPSIIGAVSDNFSNVFPRYQQAIQPTKTARRIAEVMVNEHGHEFGAGPGAVFDQKNSVIRCSCQGPSEALRVGYKHSARYIVPACNQFCENTLDYERGDELLQVGKVDLAGSVSGTARWLMTNLRRRICKVKNQFRV